MHNFLFDGGMCVFDNSIYPFCLGIRYYDLFNSYLCAIYIRMVSASRNQHPRHMPSLSHKFIPMPSRNLTWLKIRFLIGNIPPKKNYESPLKRDISSNPSIKLQAICLFSRGVASNFRFLSPGRTDLYLWISGWGDQKTTSLKKCRFFDGES